MVRWIPDNKGRFQRRPHYDPKDIDQECERLLADFRRDVGLPESPHIETDDITRLIDRHVEVLDVYADLSADGPSVEGVTLFVSGRRPAVEISSKLSEDARRANRFRTTLTHELGHVHLHDPLFQTKLATGDMFAPATEERLACKRETMVEAPAVDWMEWQACYFSGAMLMPRSAMIELARERGDGISGAPPMGSAGAESLISITVDRFDVSFDAARVRLSVLSLIQQPGSIITSI